MKRTTGQLLATTIVLGITAFAGTALGGAPEGSWYVAPQANALWLDDAALPTTAAERPWRWAARSARTGTRSCRCSVHSTTVLAAMNSNCKVSA